MALHKLGTISVSISHGGFDQNDQIDIFVDSSSNYEFVVKKNGVEIGEGASIITTTPPTFYVYPDGFTRVDVDGNLVSYPTDATFPYHKAVVSPLPDGDINDIRIRVMSKTDVTDLGSPDGSFTVEATGTNAPFKYSLHDPNTIPEEAMFDSGYFSGLPAGIYVAYAKDSEGYTDSVSIEILNKSISYSPRWRFDYQDQFGTLKRIDIEEQDYAGAVSEVIGTGSPTSFNARAELQDINDIKIMSSQVVVNLYPEIADQFISIVKSDEKTFLLKQYLHNGVSYDLEFNGYIDPYSYSDVIYQIPYKASIVARDGLGDLKYRDFLIGEKINGQINPAQLIKGEISQLQALKICLDKLNIDNGYRVACNIFEISHTTTDSTPLEQTYFSSEMYSLSEGLEVKKCNEVVNDILYVYGASLRSYAGYWYIIRNAELFNATISYVEYDKDLNFVSNGSWNPRVEFKTSEEINTNSSLGFRFMGSQARRFTKIYREAILTPNTITNEKGMLPDFSGTNAIYEYNQFSRFKDFRLYAYNTGAKNSLSLKDGNYFWQVSLDMNQGDDGNSNSFIRNTGTITFDRKDKIKVKTSIILDSDFWFSKIDDQYNSLPPFFILKWSLQVGTKFLGRLGRWSDSLVVNEEFVTEFKEPFDLDHEFQLYDTDEVTELYKLRFYAVSLTEKSSSVSLENEIKPLLQSSAYAVNNKSIGTRIVIAVETPVYNRVYYYELQDSAELDFEIKTIRSYLWNGTDNTKVWQLITTRRYNSGDIGANDNIKTNFDYINIEFIEKGISSEFKKDYKKVLSARNEESFKRTLNQFDLPEFDIKNADKTIINYLKKLDGTTTAEWYILGETTTKKIQEHQLDFIASNSKKCRGRVSARIQLNKQMTPLNVLYDQTDDGKLYIMTGARVSYKNNEMTGEILEISSDTQSSSTVSAYSTGFKQDART